VDTLPEVLLVDRTTDPQLGYVIDEARRWLTAEESGAAPKAHARRASLLALFVSSWLGGHWDERDEQQVVARIAESRRERDTNVVPLGGIRRGGQRPRALLYKLLHDALIDKATGSCELRRGGGGRLECWIRAAAEREEGGAAAAATGLLVDLCTQQHGSGATPRKGAWW
jgi:hypothetical protein